jgi:subfamily B ATP-binding cassette protein MsbA
MALGFSGALFNGIGVILIVPILLELLGVDAGFTHSLPPILDVFFRFFDNFSDQYRLGLMIAAVLSMIILKNLSSYLSALASGHVNRRLSASLRRDVLKVLLDVDLGFYSDTRIGDHVAYLTTEVHRATSAVSGLASLTVSIMTVSVFMLMLVLTSWQFTIIAIVIVGLVTLANQLLTKDAKRIGQLMTEESRAFSNKAIEMVSGIRLIKATTNENREYEILDDLIETREKLAFQSQLMFARIGPLNEILSIVGLLILAFFGRLAFQDQLEAYSPVLVTYLLILFRMLPQVGQLNSIRTRLANTSPSVALINDFLRRDNKPFMPNGYRKYTPLKQGIRFKHISFQYPNHDAMVLQDIDLYLPKGTTLALVGASGAGKSTLADLLPRFYDCTAGTIELDGIDIKDFDLKSYRQNLGIVSQDSFLFNASIRDNLLYGRPDASEAELIDAAKRANAYEFIVRLPEGMDTRIGDRGILLSGGQKQRLAIARALVQNPDILILDEATSALDTISERLVQSAIDELSRDRTTLVIAHRLSTIQRANQIAVFEKGKVIEVGTHLELLRKGGPMPSFTPCSLPKSPIKMAVPKQAP